MLTRIPIYFPGERGDKMQNRKQVLELCLYVAALVAIITYMTKGGYTPKCAQYEPPPQQEYHMPTPEPRQALEGY